MPATQVIARDRHAEVLYACAAIGTSIENFATEVRLLSRSEVGEMQEPFAEGQKGSSSMPHKRNPVTAERLVGMARVLRGYLQAGLEDVTLWHERDISHSSVERIVLPDALQLTVYMLRKATWLANGVVVQAEQALDNLNVTSLGLVYSQSILTALVEAGMNRDEAYRIVQRDSRSAIDQRRNFREVIEGDDEVELDRRADRARLRSRPPAHAPPANPLVTNVDIVSLAGPPPPVLGQGSRPLRDRRRVDADGRHGPSERL